MPNAEAAADLVGLLAYAELTAFERLAEDAKLAPSLDDKTFLARLAVAEFEHFGQLRRHLDALGRDPMAAMAPFTHAIDSFHNNTAPHDWLEGLVKAYVGDGLANDFYAEIAQHLDDPTRDLVLSVMAPERAGAEFLVSRVRMGIERDPRAAGRLALWARRLVGEALSQAQRVVAEHDDLGELLAGSDGFDLAEVAAMFARLTRAHADRMAALGLSA